MLHFHINTEHFYVFDSYIYTRNHRSGKYFCFSVATMATRTLHNIKLYVHFLSSWFYRLLVVLLPSFYCYSINDLKIIVLVEVTPLCLSADEINFKVFNLTQICNIYCSLILATSFGHHGPSSGQYKKKLKTLKVKKLVYIKTGKLWFMFISNFNFWCFKFFCGTSLMMVRGDRNW